MTPFRFRNRHFFLLDVFLLLFTPTLALALRVDAAVFPRYVEGLLIFTALSLFIKLLTFHFFLFYRQYWRYAEVEDLITIGLMVITSTILAAGIFFALQGLNLIRDPGVPRAVPFIDGMLTLVVAGGTRLSMRAVQRAQTHYARRKADWRRALIVGAGKSGATLAHDIRRTTQTNFNLDIVGFVDDDPDKLRMNIRGVPVLGSREKLPELIAIAQIHEVIVAIPSLPGKAMREIVRTCEVAGVRCRTLPGLYELLSDQVSVSRLRNVEVEDLLRREPIQTDLSEVQALIAGKRVLVTGAGGSIGSELCWQIAHCRPAQLIALGHGENSIFALTNELSRLRTYMKGHDGPELKPIIADIRDRTRLESVLATLEPQLVFHAAAHKHVPMMEGNIEDAVTNNVLGTRNMVELSAKYGVEHFVLISSDKAVNPYSVMGSTKRIAELIVYCVAERTGRPYVSVRFGNVLGSRGSVVPYFRQQIAEGGPVTITHPEITRYFMTIPEAVQLVLHATTLSQQAGVLVLDMGEPVKIVDLARDLIELSGLKIGRDIDIVFTGLRPGEKLFEELFLPSEAYQHTRHECIVMASKGQLLSGRSALEVMEQIDNLIAAARCGQAAEVRRWLKTLVPEYTPPENHD